VRGLGAVRSPGKQRRGRPRAGRLRRRLAGRRIGQVGGDGGDRAGL